MTTTPIERPDANQLLLTGGKAPEGADFGNVPPSTVAGTLLSGPTTYHAREYDAKNPGQGPLRYWPDNNPVYGVYLDLDIPGLGIRRLYIEKLRMTSAIQQAMLRAGVRKVEAGGWLSVMWTGTETGAGSLPANTYAAEYHPPRGTAPSGNAVLANGGNGYQQPAVQPAPAQWQQGVPGVVNGPPGSYNQNGPFIPPAQSYPNATTEAAQRIAYAQQVMSSPQPPPAAPVPAPVAQAPAPAAPVAQVPAQASAPVLTETIAAAMRNAGIPTDGYAIVPG